MMYTDEMDQWLAEAKREETQSQARIRVALYHEQHSASSSSPGVENMTRATSASADNSSSSAASIRSSAENANRNLVDVVNDDEDDPQTIHRTRLPDLGV
jgi:hypothetical protein